MAVTAEPAALAPEVGQAERVLPARAHLFPGRVETEAGVEMPAAGAMAVKVAVAAPADREEQSVSFLRKTVRQRHARSTRHFKVPVVKAVKAARAASVAAEARAPEAALVVLEAHRSPQSPMAALVSMDQAGPMPLTAKAGKLVKLALQAALET
ncbi:hypothetical protein [Mesorhizobium sp.]|uniref:hypothetical protein n=1 Tax=Mesorhizobium sp. TaxID=1871066 RepID=UPI0025B8FBD4|nr:hypothetical protein [Mesorhizobium sp.]